jgi:hypothetical protein
MTANYTTYTASVKAATVAHVIARDFAETVRQGSVMAVTSSIGWRPGFGSSAGVDAASKQAALQKLADVAAAATVKESAIANAKDLLRSLGEIPF